MCCMQPEDKPLVSVIMGVRYQQDDIMMLQRSIKSILDQTCRNFEFLICDDGSTEVARHYLEKTEEQDIRIHLIRNCPKTDLASKLNWCLKEAKGLYIARMDDDDWSYTQRFEKQLCALVENPQIAFVGSNVRLWRDGHVVGTRRLPLRPEIRDFLFTQPFVHPTIMFRKKALLAVGGYCEEPRCLGCEDYDLLLRFYEAGFAGINLQEFLLVYTLPALGRKKRTMALRWNEGRTRWIRFKALGLLPGALFYVVKPVLVGLLPEFLLARIKGDVKNSHNEVGL